MDLPGERDRRYGPPLPKRSDNGDNDDDDDQCIGLRNTILVDDSRVRGRLQASAGKGIFPHENGNNE